MIASKGSMAPASFDPDEAPDLSQPEWKAKFDKAKVKRGRPRLAATKIMTTIRLDAEVVAAFRADGEGWQSRINAALKDWLARGRGPDRGKAKRLDVSGERPRKAPSAKARKSA